jgi:hypothetical protein
LEGLAMEDAGKIIGIFGLHILWPFEIIYGHLVYLVLIWYIFPRFGMLYQYISGNPVLVPFLLVDDFLYWNSWTAESATP